jgi:hypothetical protein
MHHSLKGKEMSKVDQFEQKIKKYAFTTHSKMTIGIMRFSILTLSVIALSNRKQPLDNQHNVIEIKSLSITTLSISKSQHKNTQQTDYKHNNTELDTQHNNTQLNNNQYEIKLSKQYYNIYQIFAL